MLAAMRCSCGEQIPPDGARATLVLDALD